MSNLNDLADDLSLYKRQPLVSPQVYVTFGCLNDFAKVSDLCVAQLRSLSG